MRDNELIKGLEQLQVKVAELKNEFLEILEARKNKVEPNLPKDVTFEETSGCQDLQQIQWAFEAVEKNIKLNVAWEKEQ